MLPPNGKGEVCYFPLMICINKLYKLVKAFFKFRNFGQKSKFSKRLARREY